MKRTSRVAPAVAVDVRVRMAALATDLACLVDSFRSNREAPPAHSGAHRACTLAICSPFLCVCFTWSMVFRILCCSCGDHGCLKCSDACIVNTCDATFKKRTLSRVDASDLVDFAKAPEGAEKTALLAALADLAAYMKTVAADAAPTFIPVRVTRPVKRDGETPIRIKVRKGSTQIVVEWPAAISASCGVWLRDLLG